MNSTQLGIFVILAKNLNFSKTAEMLYVSQSHVSKQIAKLEEEWRVKLFHRSRHSVELTPAGEVMYRFALSLHEQMMDAVQHAQSLEAGCSTLLRVGILSQINFRQAPQIISDLKAEDPSLHVTLSFDTEEKLINGLQDNTFDIIVTNRDSLGQLSGICYRELFRSSYAISISKDEAPPELFSNGLDWLADKSLISVSDAVTISSRVLLDEMHKKFGFIPKARLDAPNQEALFRMVETGMGFAFVEAIPENTPPQPKLAFFDTGISNSLGLSWRADDGREWTERFVKRAAEAIEKQPMKTYFDEPRGQERL